MMSKAILPGIFIILVISCSTESFDYVDPKGFNEFIAGRVDITNVEDLIKIYYNYPEEEGKSEIIIKSKKISNNKVKIILIHDRLADDSLRAVKIIMIARKSGNQWHVLEIKKQWKCYEGRGHTTWDVEPCR